MNSVQSYLDKFGRNFLVASMIPSLAFFTITMISLQPILPQWLQDLLGSKFNPLGESGFLLVLMTVILGFTLTSLNTFIYKIFEGYVLIWRLPFLRQSEIKKSRKLKNVHAMITKKMERLDRGNLSMRAERKLEDLFATQNALLAKYDLTFPPNEDEIMPTKFGNILKAAETYSLSRYRMDAVSLWPRLIHVIPDSYFSKVDEISNQLSFLMNCTVLAIAYSFIALAVSLYYTTQSILQTTNLSENTWAYLLLFVLALGVGVVFLRASELVVVEYGYLIRSSFDLFRRALLKQLDLALPPTLKDEQIQWARLSYFMNIGNKNRTINFKFVPGSEESSPQSKAEISDN